MLKTASSTLFEKGVPPSKKEKKKKKTPSSSLKKKKIPPQKKKKKKKKSKSNLTLLHPVSCLAKATLPLSLSLFDHQIRDIYSYG